MTASTNVTRPALRYYGSGWNRAPWIIQHFPPHTVYCEPCFGAGSVLLRKDRAKLEVVNDLDNRVINFFTMLREKPAELAEALQLTPWHQTEFYLALIPDTDPFEDARRFAFACWASVAGGPKPRLNDFRWQKTETRRSPASADIPKTEHLTAIAKRLRHVQFLCQDATSVIRKMRGSQAVIYFDPPYLATTRRNTTAYRIEPDDAWHVAAAGLLRQHDGPVIISGYASELYAAIYEQHGFKRIDRRQRTNSGGVATESLWLSPLAMNLTINNAS